MITKWSDKIISIEILEITKRNKAAMVQLTAAEKVRQPIKSNCQSICAVEIHYLTNRFHSITVLISLEILKIKTQQCVSFLWLGRELISQIAI